MKDMCRTFVSIALYHANNAQAAAQNRQIGVANDHIIMAIDYLKQVKEWMETSE